MISNDIYLSSDIKLMDEGCGIDTDTLMNSAAEALYRCLESKGRLFGNICILCGKGNNGGDGYALAVKLLERGWAVNVIPVDEPKAPLAVKHRNAFVKLGGVLWDASAVKEADTVVDCIFGFSFKGCLGKEYACIVNAVNESGAFVLAADVPSGVVADSDTLPELCIKSDLCCCFSAMKVALASYPARAVCGEIVLADIGIPRTEFEKYTPFAVAADKRLLKLLPKRRTDGHKGSFGTLAALCGNNEMCGAAYLACLAALRSGVGLMKLYTEEGCATVTKNRLAEPIVSADCSADNILSKKADALLIGCGCGRSYDENIKKLIKNAECPLIIDADGINCIAGDIQLYRSVSHRAVITPHPAEMGRLIGKSTEEVNSRRLQTAVEFAKEYNVVTVLKGAKTVIASPDERLCISPYENTGLAKGGSGDVLAGLIASLTAQGMNFFDAACLGVYLHGEAAERLAKTKGIYAMLPSELPEIIGQIMYFG